MMMGVSAQNYKRVGKVFSASAKASHRTTTKDTLVTTFRYQTKDGKSYPIIVNITSGACYVWRISKRTNKPYKMYLNSDIKAAIAKELKK